MTSLLQAINSFASVALADWLNTLALTIALPVTAALILRFLPRGNAATRYAAWCGVLALMLVVPFVPAVVRQSAMAGPVEADETASAPVAAVTQPIAASVALEITSSEEPVAQWSLLPVRVVPGIWALVFCGIWGLLAMVQLGRIAWSYIHLRRLKASARYAPLSLRINFDEWLFSCTKRRDVRLLASAEIDAPIAVGFARPAVILPESLIGQISDAEMEHILLHELAHIARRDDWTNLAIRIVGALMVAHPLTYRVLRHIEHEREVACDDWVVATTGEARPYAESLARFVEMNFARNHSMLAASMAARSSQFADRIESLLRKDRRFSAHPSLPALAVAVAAFAMLAIPGTSMPGWIAFASETIESPAEPASPAQSAAPASASEPTPVVAAPRASASASVSTSAAAPVARASASTTPVAAYAPATAVAASAQAASTSQPAPAAQASTASSGTSFLAALNAAGYSDLSVDQIIELKIHGVTPAFITEMNSIGWPKLSAKDLVQLKIHGVTPQYLAMLRNNGFGTVSMQEAVEARIHGLRESDVQAARKYSDKLTLKQVMRMKMAGVL